MKCKWNLIEKQSFAYQYIYYYIFLRRSMCKMYVCMNNYQTSDLFSMSGKYTERVYSSASE